MPFNQPMPIDILHKINFQAPWLSHIPDFLRNKSIYHNTQPLYQVFNELLIEHHLQLTTGLEKPLLFVHQSLLDDINQIEPTAYETHIANTGQIPTRDNLHDLFNAWIWFTFPVTKAMLNRNQATHIEQDGISGTRGRVRDAITVLDENGAILVTSNPDIAGALKRFDWKNCLVEPRKTWMNPNTPSPDDDSMIFVCGHALLEQLVEPRKPLCAHTFIMIVDTDFFALPIENKIKKIDQWLSKQIDEWLHNPNVSPRDLSPLPVLGVPYFWADNECPDFYQDDYVFRSGRRKNR